MNDLTKVMNGFRGVVECSLEILQEIAINFDETEREELYNDFLQANWEQIVERTICNPGEFLEPYGDGADCNGASSRICFPNAMPTHYIASINKVPEVLDLFSGHKIDVSKLSFHSFVNATKNAYSLKSPMNAALFEGDIGIHAVLITEISFSLKRGRLQDSSK